MNKIVYLSVLFCIHTGIHAAAGSTLRITPLYFNVYADTPLGMFSDNPKEFESVISTQFQTEEDRQNQQEARDAFEKQLKTRPKQELWRTLVLACFNDAPTVAACALKAGASVSVDVRISNSDDTPLTLALQNSPALVRILLESGANANLTPNIITAQSPLYLAVHWGNPKNVSLLIKHKANPNVARFDGITPLYYAAEQGKIKIMQKLLAAGAEVDKPNKQGITPLWMAAQEGKLEAADLLLKAGADKNRSNNENVTPLQIAALNGHIDVVSLLLSADADHAAADYQGLTPLHQAAIGGHSNVIRALIRHGADRRAVTIAGETPLFIAAAESAETSAHALLHTEQQKDTDLAINYANIYGTTPLFVAVHSGNAAIFDMLVQAHASLEATTICYKKRQSLISVSAESPADVKGILALFRQYLDASLCQQLAKVQDGQGNYPIHTACAKNKIDVLQYLLDNDVPTNLRNAAGKTPYAIAFEKGHHEIAQALIRHFVSKAIRTGIALPSTTRLSVD